MYSLSNSAFMSPGLGCLVHTLFTQLNRWWGPGDFYLGKWGHSHRKPGASVGEVFCFSLRTGERDKGINRCKR